MVGHSKVCDPIGGRYLSRPPTLNEFTIRLHASCRRSTRLAKVRTSPLLWNERYSNCLSSVPDTGAGDQMWHARCLVTGYSGFIHGGGFYEIRGGYHFPNSRLNVSKWLA